jgi:hypothetical protein
MKSFAMTRNRRRSAARASALVAVAALAGAAAPSALAAEPWGFEKVTPGGKGGGAVQNTDFFQVGPDGDSLLYSTTAPFDSLPADGAAAYNVYLARRGETGWFSRSLQPKFTLGAGTSTSGGSIQSVIGTSPNLRWAVVGTPNALAPGASTDSYNLYRLDTYTGELTFMVSNPDRADALQNYSGGQGGGNIKYFADDGKTIVWTGKPNEVPGFSEAGLLRWTEEGGADVLGRMPEGTPLVSGLRFGYDSIKGDAVRGSIPRRQDGELRFAFSTSGFERAAYLQDGDTTRVISRTRLTGSPAVDAVADVRAVSDNGRFTLFATSTDNARLTDETPAGLTHVLYVYDADADTLTYVGALGSAIEAVLQMSHDGRSVAFQSSLVLADGAVAGRQNIYVWRDGTIKFVAAPDANGAAANPALFHRLLSENGRYLVFTDDSTSLAASFGFDNANPRCTVGEASPFTGRCMQVYRFDADAPALDALDCVSCRTDGLRPAGASGDPASRQGGGQFLNAHQMRMVADDGTVFFTSADDLISADANGEHDAYAWRDGQLRLLSRARTGMRSRFVDADADGSTVLISTNDPIVPTDDDRAVDLYITREGAGYPVAPPPPPEPPCTGTDCRSATAAPGLLSIGSAGFGGDGNVAWSRGVSVGVSRLNAVVGAAAKLRVRVSGPGRVVLAGSSIRPVSRRAVRAGTYTIKVRLNPRARKSLKKTKSLRVGVRVSYRSGDGGSASKVVRLTFKQPRRSKGGR